MINTMGTIFKLTIPRPTKAPTPNEELLKLDLLELTRKAQPNVYELYDLVCIAIKGRRMTNTHKVMVMDDHLIEVIRLHQDLTVIRLEPKKEEAAA